MVSLLSHLMFEERQMMGAVRCFTIVRMRIFTQMIFPPYKLGLVFCLSEKIN